MKNQKILFSLTLVISSIILTACTEEKPKSQLIIKNNLIYKEGEDKPFTGMERGMIEDKIIEYEIVDGVKHGSFRIYYNEETLAVSGQLDSNRNTGKWQYFYQSGSLESEGFFRNDQPTGKWIWLYESGIVKEEGFFDEGKKTGTWKQFNEMGELISEQEFNIEDSSYHNQIKLNF